MNDNIGIDFTKYDGKDSYFSGSDSEELYLKNLERFGNTWRYANRPIFYKRNRLGYRCKELSEIDNDNFFLTLGCSHTEGSGHFLEDTWPYLVSDMLHMDYLNHAKGGGGPDLVYINSVLFLKNSPVKPKFVVIQWPDPARFMYKNLNILRLSGINFPGPEKVKELFDMLIKHDSHLFNTYWAYTTTQLLWKLAGVPVVNWDTHEIYLKDLGINHDLVVPLHAEDLIPENRARDIMHYGPAYYQRVSLILVDYIRKKYINNIS